jgi:NACalpha-BTF3-like transcription factor
MTCAEALAQMKGAVKLPREFWQHIRVLQVPVLSAQVGASTRYITYHYDAESTEAMNAKSGDVIKRDTGVHRSVSKRRNALGVLAAGICAPEKNGSMLLSAIGSEPEKSEKMLVSAVPRRINERLATLERGQVGAGLQLESGQFEFVYDKSDGALWLVNASRMRFKEQKVWEDEDHRSVGALLGDAREAEIEQCTFRVRKAIGGADQKASGADLEAQMLDNRQIEQGFAELLEKLWLQKAGGILDELCENCRTERDKSTHRTKPMDQALLFMLGDKLLRENRNFFGKDERFKHAPLAYLSVYLYTLQDVDIDRLSLFTDCPDFPVGNESPEDRNKVYAPYREARKREHPRNMQMFEKACWATRTLWDIHAEEQAVAERRRKDEDGEAAKKREQKKAEVTEEMQKWIKWVSLLGAMRQELVPPVTTTRGLTQLPDVVMKQLMKKKPGDCILWAAMSSTTLDNSLSEGYANQVRPVSKNVLFTINQISEGLVLPPISLYPKEKEVLLPPLTLLRVRSVTPPTTNPDTPGRIVCDFGKCMITERLQEAAEKDLFESTRRFRALLPKDGRVRYFKEEEFTRLVSDEIQRVDQMRTRGLTAADKLAGKTLDPSVQKLDDMQVEMTKFYVKELKDKIWGSNLRRKEKTEGTEPESGNKACGLLVWFKRWAKVCKVGGRKAGGGQEEKVSLAALLESAGFCNSAEDALSEGDLDREVINRASKGLRITPLDRAARAGDPEIVRRLLDSGAEVDIRRASGHTPLLSAAEAGHPEVCHLLLDYQAQVDDLLPDGSGALHLVSRIQCPWGCPGAKRLETLILLLDYHADPFHRNASGYTPMQAAAGAGFKEFVDVLTSTLSQAQRKEAKRRSQLNLERRERAEQILVAETVDAAATASDSSPRSSEARGRLSSTLAEGDLVDRRPSGGDAGALLSPVSQDTPKNKRKEGSKEHGNADLVMWQTNCSHGQALAALRQNNNDIVEAIMDLSGCK